MGIAFSSPAEALRLQRTHLRDVSHDGDLADVLDLYHERDSGGSDQDEVLPPPHDRLSFPSVTDDARSSPRTTPLGAVTGSEAGPCLRGDQSPPVMENLAISSPDASQPRVSDTSALRDRYGFRCESQHIGRDAYLAWSALYQETQARRRKKWDGLLSESGLSPADGRPVHFPSRSIKLQRYVRKGIPAEYRGQAWFFYADGPRRLRDNPGLYEQLVVTAGTLDDLNAELIERDLHRTFPDNIHFKPDGYLKPTQTHNGGTITLDPDEPALIASLRRVLQAFSLHRPQVGYCQSLNFIAGLLLLFLDEEKSFWMLVIVTTTYLPNSHDANLEGANIDQAVLMLSIRDSLPAIWTKMGGDIDGVPNSGSPNVADIVTDLPPITLVTAAWFMSAFTGILPIETTLRVWDCFFYEGSKILFRMALTILKIGEPQILASQEFIEIFQIVQSLPRDMLDPGVLIEACFRRRNAFGQLSQKDIDQRRVKVARMRQKTNRHRESRDDIKLTRPGKAGNRSVFRR